LNFSSPQGKTLIGKTQPGKKRRDFRAARRELRKSRGGGEKFPTQARKGKGGKKEKVLGGKAGSMDE